MDNDEYLAKAKQVFGISATRKFYFAISNALWPLQSAPRFEPELSENGYEEIPRAPDHPQQALAEAITVLEVMLFELRDKQPRAGQVETDEERKERGTRDVLTGKYKGWHYSTEGEWIRVS